MTKNNFICVLLLSDSTERIDESGLKLLEKTFGSKSNLLYILFSTLMVLIPRWGSELFHEKRFWYRIQSIEKTGSSVSRPGDCEITHGPLLGCADQSIPPGRPQDVQAQPTSGAADKERLERVLHERDLLCNAEELTPFGLRRPVVHLWDRNTSLFVTQLNTGKKTASRCTVMAFTSKSFPRLRQYCPVERTPL